MYHTVKFIGDVIQTSLLVLSPSQYNPSSNDRSILNILTETSPLNPTVALRSETGAAEIFALCNNTNSGCLLANKIPNCSSHEEGCTIASLYTFIILPLLAISVGVVAQSLQRVLRLQYTLLLLLSGIALGCLGCSVDMALLSDSMNQWVHLDPTAIFFEWFLAPLIFEASFNSQWFTFKKLFIPIVYAAFVLVIVQTGLVAVFQIYVIQSPGWNWWSGLMFGAMLTATDPIAVTATLKAIGAPETLATLIEGESQLNDGSAFVLWEALFANVEAPGSSSVADIVVNIIRLSLGGVAMGLAFGIVGTIFLALVYEMFEVEVSITIIVAFLGFWTAQYPSKLSGVIANVTSGLVLSQLGKPFVSPSVRGPLEEIWRLLSWIANTVVFFYAGVLIVAFIWSCAGGTLQWYDYLHILSYYAYLQALRFILVYLSYPVFAYKQKWWNWRNAFLVSFAGLRGSVALILALEVGDNPNVSSEITARVVVWTGGVVALCLLINGGFIKQVIHVLKLDEPNLVREDMLWQAKGAMLQSTYRVFDRIAVDGFMQGADWKIILETVIPKEWRDNPESAAKGFAQAVERRSSVALPMLSGATDKSRTSVSLSSVAGLTDKTPVLVRQSFASSTGTYDDSDAIKLAEAQLEKENAASKKQDFAPAKNQEMGSSSIARPGVQELHRMSSALDTIETVIQEQLSMSMIQVGTDVDIEIRRRYLQSLLTFVNSKYETSFTSFRALQSLSNDIKFAMEENELGEPVLLFDFALHKQHSRYMCIPKPRFIRKLSVESQFVLLSLIVRGVGQILSEPFMEQSRLVLREAEMLFQGSSMFLEKLEAFVPLTKERVHTMMTINQAFDLQESLLKKQKESGEIDSEQYTRIRNDIVEKERYFTTIGHHAIRKHIEGVSASQALRRSTLFSSFTDDQFDSVVQSYGRITDLTGRQPLAVEDAGIILVLDGSLQCLCANIYGESTCNCLLCLGRTPEKLAESAARRKAESEQKADHETTDRKDKKKNARLKHGGVIEVFLDDDDGRGTLGNKMHGLGNPAGRSSLAMISRPETTFHWCFSTYSVIASPRLVYMDPKIATQPFVGCSVIGKATVFTLPIGICENLMESNEAFRLEVYRSMAHKLVLNVLAEESPYGLFAACKDHESTNVVNEDGSVPMATVAFDMLSLLPYSDVIRIPHNQVVIVQGPGVLMRGKVNVKVMRADGEFSSFRVDSNSSKSVLLPLGTLVLELDAPHGHNPGIADFQPDIAEVLVVPAYRNLEEQAQASSMRWKPTGPSIGSSSRFCVLRHLDVPAEVESMLISMDPEAAVSPNPAKSPVNSGQKRPSAAGEERSPLDDGIAVASEIP